jgi:hypothetical protein
MSSMSFNLSSFILAAAEAANRRSALKSSVLFRKKKHMQKSTMKMIAAKGVKRTSISSSACC